MKYDVVIANGTLFLSYGEMGKRDIGVKDGRIVAVEDRLEKSDADIVINASDKVVVPGFVDSHIHMDKAFSADADGCCGLLDACNHSKQEFTAYYQGWSSEDIISDMMENIEKVVQQCIVNGTSAVRINVAVNPVVRTAGLQAVNRIREKYKEKIDILVTADCPTGMEKEWEDALRHGWIDFIGGYPNLKEDARTHRICYDDRKLRNAEYIFALSEKYKLPVDLHCDESDEPDFTLFRYICEQTWRRQMEGEVTVSHITALGARGAEEEAVADAIAWCAKAGVHVTTLTGQNLFLMPEDRRGTTRVKQLRDAGVRVAIASDNVRDAFCPFGNYDLMEEALLTAQVHKLGTDRELLDIMNMITYFPAASCKLEAYGLLPGCAANLVILDADYVPEALRSQAKKSYVMHLGKIVAKNGKIV